MIESSPTSVLTALEALTTSKIRATRSSEPTVPVLEPRFDPILDPDPALDLVLLAIVVVPRPHTSSSAADTDTPLHFVLEAALPLVLARLFVFALLQTADGTIGTTVDLAMTTRSVLASDHPVVPVRLPQVCSAGVVVIEAVVAVVPLHRLPRAPTTIPDSTMPTIVLAAAAAAVVVLVPSRPTSLPAPELPLRMPTG
jgi:hypothetical protein